MIKSEPDFTINDQGIGEQVYERTREAILNGRFVLGERITIRALADSFRVSISPVRDALKRLESDGLVEIVPRRGVFVVQVTGEVVRETFEIRQIIECACAQHMDALTEDDIRDMNAIVDEMEALREENSFRDYPRYLELDSKLHLHFVEMIRNKRLSEIYRQLRWPVQLAVVLSRAEDHRAAAGIAEHRAIIAALSARDKDGVNEAISTHLSNAAQDMLRHLEPSKGRFHDR